MIELTSTQTVVRTGIPLSYIPNARAARFNRPRIHCAACGFRNRPADTKWLDLCEQCGGKIRKADNRSISLAGIHMDMMLAGIPVKFGRGGRTA